MGGSNCRDSELATVMKVSGRGMLSREWDICVTPAKTQGTEQYQRWKGRKGSGRDSGATPCLLGMTRHTTKSRKLGLPAHDLSTRMLSPALSRAC